LPVGSETRITPEHLRTLIVRRLRLPALSLTPSKCKCGGKLDSLGDHRAACSTSGRLHPRSKPLERALARVCREAGARVATNMFLRDLNLANISPLDGRQIEICANGLPLWGGQQLAIDATIVGALRRDGRSQPGASRRDGVQLQVARRRKERAYPELTDAPRCRLVVFATEVGGRWSSEAVLLVQLLAKAKARAAPRLFQKSAELAFYKRWTAILAVAAQSAVASSLLDDDLRTLDAVDGDTPEFHEVLCGGQTGEEVAFSRMPPRC
jgi:hypothetical protein